MRTAQSTEEMHQRNLSRIGNSSLNETSSNDFERLFTVMNRQNIQKLPDFSGEIREWPYFVKRLKTVEQGKKFRFRNFLDIF